MAERAEPADPAPRHDPPGLSNRQGEGIGLTGPDIAAIAASVVWLIVCVIFLTAGGEGAGSGLVTTAAVILPIMTIWAVAIVARAARVIQDESRRLQITVDGLRKAYLSQAQAGRAYNPQNAIIRKLTEISASQKNFEATLAMVGSARMAEGAAQAGAPEAGPDDQPALSLGTPAEAMQPPLANEDYISALNFPETAEDEAGFAALRRALRDHQTAQLIRASQDILTLMSQEGIYMDDLQPDMARAETWRAFAEGARGREIAALGGVQDRATLALTAGRMKQDPIFRDAAHHFLRRFDQSFAGFAQRASDAEVQAFADTRTARAFMILGRVAGTFD